jgi:hypothetical protein
MVGDTDSTDPLLTDEEISYLLVVHVEAPSAAVGAARAIAGKFSREADKQRAVGDLSLSESMNQKATAYHHLADHLIQLASGITMPPIPKAASTALGAEFTIGLLDKYEL